MRNNRNVSVVDAELFSFAEFRGHTSAEITFKNKLPSSSRPLYVPLAKIFAVVKKK